MAVQKCNFAGTIDIPIYAAPYTVTANAGTPALGNAFFRMNTNGDLPFSDRMSYRLLGTSVGAQSSFGVMQNGTVTLLGYAGLQVSTIGGGYSPSGYSDRSFQGSFYNGVFGAAWLNLPGAIVPSPTTSPVYTGQYQIGLNGGDMNVPPMNLLGAIIEYGSQFPLSSSPAQPSTSSQNQSNGGYSMPVAAAVVITNATDPLDITDTGLRLIGSSTWFANGPGQAFYGVMFSQLATSYIQSTTPPPLIQNYVPTNTTFFPFQEGVFTVHGQGGFDNYIWSEASGAIQQRQISLFFDLRTMTLTPITQLWGGVDIFNTITFDDASLNAAVASGQYEMHPCKGATAVFFQTGSQDYILNYDGSLYWKLNYVPQIGGAVVPQGFTDGINPVSPQVKTIDVNNVFWYTGNRYNNGGSTGNITPLFSFSLNINLPTIPIPAFPPLQLPCFADCLAQGSVLAKQTKWG